MKKMISDYKAMIEDITAEVTEGMISEKNMIQVLREAKAIVQDYRPIIDWYYDADTMQDEVGIPFEEMYMEDEYPKEEMAEMKKQFLAYKAQYEAEKDKLEEISVKAALTEMKQMIKLFGK